MKIAIHQPNFCPWLPFFYKMAMVDKFVILKHVQFEKNGFQNRYRIGDKWVTRAVTSGTDWIAHKTYADGTSLIGLNMQWIYAMKNALGIETEIVYDYPTDLRSTDKLIDLVQHYGGTTYVTNPSAKDKYLDEDRMWMAGINIEYCKPPKQLQLHTFEAFDKWGIDGVIKQLPAREQCRV